MMKSIPVWKQELSDGVHAARLASLYCCSPAETASEAARYTAVLDGLEKTFGSHAEAGLYSAPGRTEIGGNHTDHQHGRVLAGSVNIDMIAAAAPNDKNQLRVQSEGYDLCVIDLNDLEARKEEENTTAALLRGECAAFTQRGAKLAGLVLCILDSGADHADLTDEYAAIPAECRAVAAVCGGEVLRDVPFETFLAKLPECRRQCGDRAVLRAFHVYADNDRVAKQVAALHDGDFDTFLCLVNESGRSSWEYLQNVIPAGYKEHQEVGVTIAAAKHLLGDKGAVRVHGGGFAGTVQAFVPVEMLDKFKAGMEAILGEGRCHVLSIRPEGGAVL